MGPRKIQGNKKLAEEIKSRRIDLGMTIEEAAQKAGVGIKTWCRYEAGESIRADKYNGVCKALNWRGFNNEEKKIDIPNYKKHKHWSKYLEEEFGVNAAASFVIGSDILRDDINQDIFELSRMPKETHIGQVECSMLADLLPCQFLMRYDYDFVYIMKIQLEKLCRCVEDGGVIVVHSVLDELLLYLIVQEATVLMDEVDIEDNSEWGEWIYDVFGDEDIELVLYSDYYVDEDNIYHFNHWVEQQFYCDR